MGRNPFHEKYFKCLKLTKMKGMKEENRTMFLDGFAQV